MREERISQSHYTNEASTSLERKAASTPLIYVASLADYTEGRLHGVWVDATRDVGDIYADIRAMLDASPSDGAEEYGIHDYTGFYDFVIGEYESLDTVTRIARGIAEHGEAFAAFIDVVGADETLLDTFDDCYVGTYASIEEYVAASIEMLGWDSELERLRRTSGIGEFLRIDEEHLREALLMDWDVCEGTEGVHVFNR